MKNVSEESINAWTGSGFGLDLLDTQEDGPTSAGSAITLLAANRKLLLARLFHRGYGNPGGKLFAIPSRLAFLLAATHLGDAL